MSRILVGKDLAAIDNDFQLAHRVTDFGLNAPRLQFALKAPGQAAQIASNQAAADFNVHRCSSFSSRSLRRLIVASVTRKPVLAFSA